MRLNPLECSAECVSITLENIKKKPCCLEMEFKVVGTVIYMRLYVKFGRLVALGQNVKPFSLDMFITGTHGMH